MLFTNFLNTVPRGKYILLFNIALVISIICLKCSIKTEQTLKLQQKKDFLEEKKLSEQVDSVLKLMTLDEKIGQLVLFSSDWDQTGPFMKTDYLKEIKSGRCGNIFNAYTAAYTRELQRIAVEETRLGIPLLIGYDVIHGYKTIFPVPLAMASSWNVSLIKNSIQVSTKEAAAAGINWTYAPVADISCEPRWGRIMEGFGEDPYLASEIVKVCVSAIQGITYRTDSTMLACVKHFAAYGAPFGGRDYNTVDISRQTLFERYLPPFEAAVVSGTGSVMASFNELFGIPATCNAYLLTDILKRDWNFKGFVVSDYTGIKELIDHGIADNEEDAALLAFNAGLDMDMQSGLYSKHLKKLVLEGKIPENKIDEAVKRVLRIKFMLGLFDDPYKYSDPRREKERILTDENVQIARRMTRESLVLLKNNNATLPLKKGTRLAVIGPLADSKDDLLGSWRGKGEWDSIPSIVDAFKKYDKKNVIYRKGCEVNTPGREGFPSAIAAANRADIIVLVLGESCEMSGEAASRSSINLPGVQTELLKELSQLGKPLILILLNGRPLALQTESKLSDAILEAWFPGSEGAMAIVETVYGDNNPSGKLPVTFPLNLGQIPIFYSHKNTGRPFNAENKFTSKYLDCSNDPLYPFGFGLSYTTFQYQSMELSGSTLRKNEILKIQVTVKNTGISDGQEIVQLYIRDKVGSITRPVNELKRFVKLFIPKGVTKEVLFTIKPEDLAFYHDGGTFHAEVGEFVVSAGSNSTVLLSKSFWLVE